MTKKEKTLVMGVFGSLLQKSYSELNTFLGSLTIQEMQEMYSRLEYEDYCNDHGIKYEDMTDDDFIQACLEKYEA